MHGSTLFADGDALDAAKRALRAEIRRRLAAMEPERRAAESRVLCGVLAGRWAEAQAPAAFVPLADEPDIFPLLEAAWAGGRTVLLPRMDGGGLRWCAVQGAGILVPGPFGVREPSPAAPVADRPPDLLLVPGCAFDAAGRRLGRGKGYYDRQLQGWEGVVATVGVAFDCQLVEHVPAGPGDFPVGAVAAGGRLRAAEPNA